MFTLYVIVITAISIVVFITFHIYKWAIKTNVQISKAEDENKASVWDVPAMLEPVEDQEVDEVDLVFRPSCDVHSVATEYGMDICEFVYELDFGSL